VDPNRLGWAITTAREAREAAGLDADQLALGSYVPVFVHDDRETARRSISGTVGSYARFSVMHGSVAGPVAEGQRQTLEAVHNAYDMNAHFKTGSPQAQQLTDEVIDAFAVAGPPSYCLEQFGRLADMGLTRIFVTGAARGLDPQEAERSRRRFVTEVLPYV
jgi:5,10-methylenetetrahydromethanopterin reductase